MDTRVDDGCTELCPEADRQLRPASPAEDRGRHQVPPAQVQAVCSRWDWTPAKLPHGAKVHAADGMGLDTFSTGAKSTCEMGLDTRLCPAQPRGRLQVPP